MMIAGFMCCPSRGVRLLSTVYFGRLWKYLMLTSRSPRSPYLAGTGSDLALRHSVTKRSKSACCCGSLSSGVLRMPLHPHDPRITGDARAFDDAVGGPGIDDQSVTDAVHCLVVMTATSRPSAERFGQARSRLDHDVHVDTSATVRHAMEPHARTVGDVLIETLINRDGANLLEPDLKAMHEVLT